MLILSICSLSTAATEKARARRRISRASSWRRFAGKSLESRRPRTGRLGSRTTAAATTGPHRAPRPASSTPATQTKPCVHTARSWRNVQRRRRKRRSFSAAAERTASMACLPFTRRRSAGRLDGSFTRNGKMRKKRMAEKKEQKKIPRPGGRKISAGSAEKRRREALTRLRAGGRPCRGARASKRAGRGGRAKNAAPPRGPQPWSGRGRCAPRRGQS